MTIEKRNAGSYRIVQMYQGVRYRVYVDHKPTKREATILMAEKLKQAGVNPDVEGGTFEAAGRDYIKNRGNVCSPSTLRGYEGMLRNLPDQFKKMNVYDVDRDKVQELINDYAKDHSAKSVRNLHGFISCVLKLKNDALVLKTTLPKRKREPVFIPSFDQVNSILQEVKGSKYEVALHLAAYGLRRSEICALTADDLNGNLISVNKAKVQKPDQSWEIKNLTKTDASTRTIYVDDYVRDLIVKQGYVYKGHPEHIKTKLENVEKKLGIPHFTLHKMRHYYASKMHNMGISDADIMQGGGWSSDYVMKTVYRHANESTVSEGQLRYAEMMQRMKV